MSDPHAKKYTFIEPHTFIMTAYQQTLTILLCLSDWFTYLFVFGVYQGMVRPNRGCGVVKGERGKSHVLCVFL